MSFANDHFSNSTKQERTISSNTDELGMFPVTQSIYKGAEDIHEDDVIMEERASQEKSPFIDTRKAE